MEQTCANGESALAVAIDAYIYAFPLVLIDATMKKFTNVLEADRRLNMAPMNQFVSAIELQTATSRDVGRPNVDTLYSTAWLDLRAEPIIFRKVIGCTQVGQRGALQVTAAVCPGIFQAHHPIVDRDARVLRLISDTALCLLHRLREHRRILRIHVERLPGYNLQALHAVQNGIVHGVWRIPRQQVGETREECWPIHSEHHLVGRLTHIDRGVDMSIVGRGIRRAPPAQRRQPIPGLHLMHVVIVRRAIRLGAPDDPYVVGRRTEHLHPGG